MLDGRGTCEFPPVDIRSDGSAVVGEARGYVDLIMALRAQAERLGAPQLAIDEVAGVAAGFSGHCLVGRKRLGPQSMGLIIQALGVKLLVVEDETATPRVKRLMHTPRGRGPRRPPRRVARCSSGSTANARAEFDYGRRRRC